MAEVKFSKGSEEWQMFMDYWALCQKYWDPVPEDSDAFWTECIREFTEFEEKFSVINSIPFELSKNWAITIVEYLDKRKR